MLTALIEALGHFATSLISSLGYGGIVLGMAIESFNIPLPSEVIMPFAGALAASGRFSFWLVVLAGAVGNVIGSVANYYAGAKGGRPFVERYGRYIFIHPEELDAADRWFAQYGLAAVFFTRMLPVVRTFISFPAGIARVPMAPFIGLTFLGSLLWSAFLTYLGFSLGAHYDTTVRPLLHRFDYVIVGVLVLGILWYLKRHFSRRSRG